MLRFLRLLYFTSRYSGPPIIRSCQQKSVFRQRHRVRPVVIPVKDNTTFGIILEAPPAGKVIKTACAIGFYGIDAVGHDGDLTDQLQTPNMSGTAGFSKVTVCLR